MKFGLYRPVSNSLYPKLIYYNQENGLIITSLGIITEFCFESDNSSVLTILTEDGISILAKKFKIEKPEYGDYLYYKRSFYQNGDVIIIHEDTPVVSHIWQIIDGGDKVRVNASMYYSSSVIELVLS